MIGRARLVLLAALVCAVALVAAQFPFSEILHTRAAASTAAHELSALRSENRSLSRDVASLQVPSVIARIAHEVDGLVRRGETSEIVLPSRAAGRLGSTEATLGTHKLPRSDLVPNDSLLDPASAASGRRPMSFWARLLDRLEFWKAIV